MKLQLLLIIIILYTFIININAMPLIYSNQITSNIFIDKQYDNTNNYTNYYKAILYTGIIGVIVSSLIILLSLLVIKNPNHINLDYIE
jgi:hypothetical protein